MNIFRTMLFLFVGALSYSACSNDDNEDTIEWPTAQIEITEAAPLLDAQGNLALQGWARHPLPQYNPEVISAENRRRLKEWEHYTVNSPEATFAITVSNVGLRIEGFNHLVLVSVELVDLATGKTRSNLDVLINDPDYLTLPRTPYGDTDYRHAGNRVTYSWTGESRIVEFDLGAEIGDWHFTGRIELAERKSDESVVSTLPFDSPDRWFYEDKAFGLPASGEVLVNDERYEFQPATAYGVLDWGRGVWPDESEWYWGAAGGIVDGHKVGFNIGVGVGDETLGSSNAVSVDNVVHKIEYLQWDWDPQNPLTPWTVTSSDGRFEFVLEPVAYQFGETDLGVAYTTIDKVHGYWSGTAILDDGTTVQWDNLIGFCENAYQRW